MSRSSATLTSAEGPASNGPVPHEPAPTRAGRDDDWGNPRVARNLFLWPALLAVLFLALFPLVASLGLALSYFSFAKGGFALRWAGINNFTNLFSGFESTVFLGMLQPPNTAGWVVFLVGAGLLAWALWRGARSGRLSLTSLLLRSAGAVFALALLWLFVESVFGPGGFPGSLITTLIYAFGGTSIEYVLGLGLAMLTIQRLPGQRLFRVLFLIPMTITPVGVAYMFRMLTDTLVGPFAPLWSAAGLANFSLLNDPWGARIAVILGDVWQWTPFMFIVLIAALEGRDLETEEAGLVDGASRWQIFRYITLPSILPVSATVVFIRLVEAFKIIDLPNVMTNGGPGTATESVTMEAYLSWKGFDLGLSAATAYALLVLVTIVALAYVSFVLRRARAETMGVLGGAGGGS